VSASKFTPENRGALIERNGFSQALTVASRSPVARAASGKGDAGCSRSVDMKRGRAADALFQGRPARYHPEAATKGRLDEGVPTPV
jgi:hypothetical protein